MATVKENITNALTWFYERLKSNDLDPMQEQIDELNSNIGDLLTTQVGDVDNVEISSSDYVELTINMSLDGYSLIGIVGVRITNASTNGTNGSWSYCSAFYASSSTQATIRIRSTYTARVRIRIYGLYEKN